MVVGEGGERTGNRVKRGGARNHMESAATYSNRVNCIIDSNHDTDVV